MEDSKQSDQIVELGKRIYAQFEFIEKRFDFVDQRIDEIETMIQRLFWFIEFHLGEVPMKYRKSNPEKGEYPYFKPKTDFQKELLNNCFHNGFSEMKVPIDPKERESSLKRMKAYSKEKDKISETYYDLLDFSSGEWEHKGETLSPKEAQQWVDEGPHEEIHTEFSGVVQRPLRHSSQKTRRVLPKPASSEASSSPSQSQDSNQLDKIDVPSPSSDEPPGHKSPPFQT